MHSCEQPGQVFDEVGGRVYAALRSGDLDADSVVELACLVEEWGRRTAAVQEVLERPAPDLTAADLARLGERLLDDIGFEPTFALEPGLWATLEQALGIVERDVRATGIAGTLRLVTPDWDDSGRAWAEFRGGHHGNGVWPVEGRDLQGALASVADAAQETIMELIWTVWPACPVHHLGLHAELEHGAAVWRCAGAGAHTVAPVGALPSQRR
ncbi:hypothetical protein HS041_26800 [Planomonospora sp. ID67723]|uniref:hypothetical protein n=1 Tax=Planomonospora sp. ID67723 TaxID=2738134 RepID=UPI0018C37311|nr:hypothetical protein [Planomonospora sp. ID67723]MBG0831360.1 hypothetical protein [Planomonospora sp. ID67723]